MTARESGMALMTVLWLVAGISWLVVQWTSAVQREIPFLRDTQRHVQQQVQASNRWQCLRHQWLEDGMLTSAHCVQDPWFITLTPPETSPCSDYGMAHRCTFQILTLRQAVFQQRYLLLRIHPPERPVWRAAYVCARQRCTSTSS